MIITGTSLSQFDDAFIEQLASDYLGHNFFSADVKRKLKAKARYQMKKNPQLKELVMNTIEQWEDDRQSNLGGIEVHEIMDSTFPSGWS